MVGPALGGVAVAVGGTVTALLANSGVFALIALTLATAAGLPGSVPDRTAVSGRLRSALSYARGQPLVRTLLGLQAASMLFVSIPIPVEVVLAEHTLHGGAGGYGALLSAWGAGAVVGSLIYARWQALPARALIAFGVCCVGAGTGVMAIAPSLAVAIGGAAIGGVGNGIMFVANRTALQEAVEGGWMAMMMSLNESIIQGVPGAGILLGGALTAAAGPRPALAAGGIGAVATSFAVWVMLRPGAVQSEPSGTADEPPPVGPLTEAGRRRQAGQEGAYR
jgi:MFS family permease